MTKPKGGLRDVRFLWRRWNRRIDRFTVWPRIYEEALSRVMAEQAMRLYMEGSPNYADMSDEEKEAYVKSLP